MYTGTVTHCLRVSDLEKSIRFYEALGMGVSRHPGGRAANLRRGHFNIYLITFGVDSINFRGADAFEVHAHLQASGIEAKGKPEHTTPPGTAWTTEDPDGHKIFFNTFQQERTPDAKRARVVGLLRCTEHDTIDWGARDESLRALRQVLAKLEPGEPTAPTRPYAGSPFLCLRVNDVEKSVRFYEALGLTVTRREPQGATVRRGNFSIYLMGFDSVDCINFRGADAFEVQEQLRKNGIEAPGKPEHTRDPGTSWMTEDPDGHKIFFNTFQSELTPAARQTRVGELLRWTEQDLVDWDASEELLQAFREHVLGKL
jgi:catechol 2,3-dioxygenase-like lactoylglutathione lyase family enzyme